MDPGMTDISPMAEDDLFPTQDSDRKDPIALSRAVVCGYERRDGSVDGIVLWPDGYIEEEMDNYGNNLVELQISSNTPTIDGGCPTGISIWEGRWIWHEGPYEYPDDGEFEVVGEFREPTSEEWFAIQGNRSPFQPVTRRQQFLDLKAGLHHATRFLSWIDPNEPYLTRIIAMGRPVVPLILEDLEHHDSMWLHWTYALRTILGDGPEIPEDCRGRMNDVKLCWFDWANGKNFR